MIRTVALLGLVASASALFGLWEDSEPTPWLPGLAYKFDINPFTWGKSSFARLPCNCTAAKKKSWELAERPTKSYSSGFDKLELWVNPQQLTVGILVDENGQTSGLQISIPQIGLKPYYDMEEQGFTLWTYANQQYWTICEYFVSEDEETRKQSYNESLILRDKKVVVEGINGEHYKIAINLDDIASIWTKHACVLWMGLHFYYNMTETLGCDKPFHPWFPLYDDKTKQLTGMGLMVMGSSNSTEFEKPSTDDVKMIVPTGPECLYDLVDSNSVITLHTYFINEPLLIVC